MTLRKVTAIAHFGKRESAAKPRIFRRDTLCARLPRRHGRDPASACSASQLKVRANSARPSPRARTRSSAG